MDRNGIGNVLLKEDCEPWEAAVQQELGVDTFGAPEKESTDSSDGEEGEGSTSLVAENESTQEISNGAATSNKAESQTSEVHVGLDSSWRTNTLKNSSDAQISYSNESFITPPRVRRGK